MKIIPFPVRKNNKFKNAKLSFDVFVKKNSQLFTWHECANHHFASDISIFSKNFYRCLSMCFPLTILYLMLDVLRFFPLQLLFLRLPTFFSSFKQQIFVKSKASNGDSNTGTIIDIHWHYTQCAFVRCGWLHSLSIIQILCTLSKRAA